MSRATLVPSGRLDHLELLEHLERMARTVKPVQWAPVATVAHKVFAVLLAPQDHKD